MQRLPSMLIAWGDWWIRNLESMGLSSVNLLYKLVREGGARPDVTYETDDEGEVLTGRDRILCPDAPGSVRKVQRAVNRLPNWEQKCIIMWYCAPLKEDGHPYTKRALARRLSMSMYKFDSHLKYARKKLKKLLDD